MMLAKLRRVASLCAPPLLLAAALTPRAAEACGGFFCDAGPTVMPVDQTGETIVFWIDETGPEPFTEAHIQIQYKGEAEQFAWIIPVLAVPDVLVGSQALFDNMLQATVPQFITQNNTVGDCQSGFGFGCSRMEAVDLQGGSSFAGDGGEAEAGDGDGPNILDRGFAGAFEYVTLTGDSVDEVVSWLEMAGYAQDDEAPPILQQYLDEDFVFVAVKLRSGASVEEIHPLAIRYAGIEPCIPIRLTRIAAVEDMAIRALFLGEQRVVPQNWPHVVINHARLDYVNGPASSYPEVVGLAIDEAGGRAFVTEYAGTDAIVSTTGIHDPAWSSAPFPEIEVTKVVDELTKQGLSYCEGSGCLFSHPQVEVLLQTYLPPPEGVYKHDFWSCLSCYVEEIDLELWDPVAFAAAFEERIVQPGEHALAMLSDAEYLTRLYTVISPHEMIEDPLFHTASGLETVDNSLIATQTFDCDGGPTVFALPDGRTIAVTVAGTMPDLDMPAAERIEQIPMMGPPQIVTDNGAAIDAAIEAYNDTRLVGPGPNCAVRGFDRRGVFEGVLTMAAVFGIAWLHRGRRRRSLA